MNNSPFGKKYRDLTLKELLPKISHDLQQFIGNLFHGITKSEILNTPISELLAKRREQFKTNQKVVSNLLREILKWNIKLTLSITFFLISFFAFYLLAGYMNFVSHGETGYIFQDPFNIEVTKKVWHIFVVSQCVLQVLWWTIFYRIVMFFAKTTDSINARDTESKLEVVRVTGIIILSGLILALVLSWNNANVFPEYFNNANWYFTIGMIPTFYYIFKTTDYLIIKNLDNEKSFVDGLLFKIGYLNFFVSITLFIFGIEFMNTVFAETTINLYDKTIFLPYLLPLVAVLGIFYASTALLLYTSKTHVVLSYLNKRLEKRIAIKNDPEGSNPSIANDLNIGDFKFFILSVVFVTILTIIRYADCFIIASNWRRFLLDI